MSTPPLHWSIDVHAIQAPVSLSYEANAQELDALKRYAEVEDVKSFKAQVKIVPLSSGKFRATGILRADAVQASVVDLSAVPAAIEENFSAEFWPQDEIEGTGEEPASFEEEPPEAIVGGRILICEFLCELFSVSLDPYPRNEGDTFSWEPAKKEPSLTPFAELARLRQKKPDGG